MVGLFLDANILLDFYRFGQDDIEEIKKLDTLIEEQEITFYSNGLLEDEVNRARDAIVSNSFEQFKSANFHVRPPSYCQDIEGLRELQAQLKEANRLHSDFVGKVLNAIRENNLAADTLIRNLFENAETIELTQEIKDAAKFRLQVNNPPRKAKDSIADSIHWESLLNIRSGADFHLVTRDGDFASDLEPEKIKDFLKNEWQRRHGSYCRITLHTSLSSFFQSQFPAIKLSNVAKVNALVERLVNSPNFATTHSVIAELSGIDQFTRRQVERMFRALVENNQVGWIGADDDVKEFFLQLQDQAFLVPHEIQQVAAQCLEVSEDFFFPF